MNLDTSKLNLLNLLLCGIIFIIGSYAYWKTRHRTALLITVAFTLFGISHLMTLLGIAQAAKFTLLIVRTAAYLSIVLALSIIAVND